MADHIFKIDGIVKTFKDRTILNDISFDIKEGEIFGIIGPSGSGKTTLLNTIIGFIQPDQGEVLFKLDHVIESSKENNFQSVIKKHSLLKKMFGFASQVPSFYHNLTIRENLDYFGSLYDLYPEALDANIDTLLNLLDLKNYEDILAKNLSGGMERRLDIACALIHDPPILILDEPTSDLDPILRAHIWNLIRKINSKGTTIIISSHNLSELEHLCSRIAILKDGKILDVDTPYALKNKYLKLEEVHIESYPGDYDKLIPELTDKDIKRKEIRGSSLVLFTNKPRKVLQILFDLMKAHKEEIIDIKIGKGTLNDMFINLYKEEKDEIYKDRK